jgi:soluble lytic murein transglycosylase
MKRSARLPLFFALVFAGLACNMQRVLDPSLPTSTLASQVLTSTSVPPTAAVTPLPTLSVQTRVESADLLFLYGDWDRALRAYQQSLDDATQDDLRAASLLGMGRSYIELERYEEAHQSLDTLLGLFPDSPQAADAYFALAHLAELEDEPAAAAQAYQDYLSRRTGVIDAYAQEWRGDSLVQAGDLGGALSAYTLALAASRLSDTITVQYKIANVYNQQQDYSAALAAYQAIFDGTTNEYLKAEMDLNIGRVYISMGNTAEAYARYQHAVANYPLAYSAYAALVELVSADQTVDDLQRGLIDYYTATNTTDAGNRAELYGVAIAAFDRYLQTAPADHDDTAHYFRGLALYATGDYSQAVNEFNHIINEHAFGEHWVDAFLEKADIQWRAQDNYDGAIETLQGFVASTPSQPAAAEFLFTAGQIAEIGGRLTLASEIWPRVANEYPASEFAYQALFNAGIARYRLEDYVGAQSLFARANQAALGLEQEAQSLFWVAKAQQAQSDEASATATWQQVVSLDPTGYYSERAADIIAGRPPFDPPAGYAADYDEAAERQEAEDWIRSTFALPTETDLTDLGSLQNDARFLRGSELWRLGEYEAARAEFESLRLALTSDPANSYRLANYLKDLGLYRTAIFAAREVLNMAGLSDAGTLSAPTYFNRIRFGTYYRELVEPEANGEGIDPYFLYSMMRQESLFEGFVTSSAGARGLLQILPGTGEEQATLSGWPPDFEADDLYRPVVSIRLGTDYLARQLHAFDYDYYAALAAYNGGPGNADYWQSLAKGDPDLFVEVVQFQETADHIRSIYELFDIYRNLYGQD